MDALVGDARVQQAAPDLAHERQRAAHEHAGLAGQRQRGHVDPAGPGVAENMMSGVVHVKGDASQSAGATGCGGLLIVEGKTSARCGISLKGLDIIVRGSVGHMSGFMAQAGRIVVLGDAGEALGDSIYEAEIFVRGAVKSLGADCVEKPLDEETAGRLADLLARSGVDEVKPQDFRRYGSARELYHFKPHNVGAY